MKGMALFYRSNGAKPSLPVSDRAHLPRCAGSPMMGRAMMTVGLLLLILFSFGAPFTAEAQPAARVPKIGFLQAAQNENTPAFFRGLRDAGYVDGQSARIEAR